MRSSQVLRADIGRCVEGGGSGARRITAAIASNPGLQAILVYRFGRLLLKGKRRPVAWPSLVLGAPLYLLAAAFVRQCYGVRLYLTADIGPGFWVGHFGGVELANCRIGAQCSVGQQTQVGSRSDRLGPQIGDGVWIGAHAKVVGTVKVGDAATIAPGARVKKDVPPHALVVGNPARIVFRRYDNRAILPRG
jgi:serine O-acetyltransferase